MARRRHRPHGTGSLFKREPTGPYIARWFDHSGKRRERSTRTTDKAAAERILAARINAAALRREGVVDARADQFAEAARQPLTQHIEEWHATIAAKRTRKHADLLKTRATALM